MPDALSLVWVNKTRDSSSLSNCRSDSATFGRIRSHALTVAHQSSRVRRPLKRRPLDLIWVQKGPSRRPTHDTDFCSQASSLRHGHRDLLNGHAVQLGAPSDPRTKLGEKDCSYRLQRRRASVSDVATGMNLTKAPIVDCLNGIADPFSSCSIEVDAAALDCFWYFANVWTQCAFKIPGCVGYGQAPIEQYEITAMVQRCLANTIHCYCMLAATSARMQYLRYEEDRSGNNALGHDYAKRALCELRGRIQEHNGTEVASGLSEEMATDILFLAAYELFCCTEEGAQIHLTAVRRLYRQGFSNTFMSRLQANLEILCNKNMVRAF